MRKIFILVFTFIIVFTVSASAGTDYKGKGAIGDDLDLWAEKEVSSAVEQNLVPSNWLKDFRKPINREQFCILAIKLIEARTGKDINTVLKEAKIKIAPVGTFKDCDTLEVRAAKALGITDGVGNSMFSPNSLLTREQAAKFLTTTAIACGKDVNLSTPSYSDIDKISDWAKPYIGYVKEIGVMKGVGANMFAPKGDYQRQQAFMTIYRLWKAIPNVNVVAYENLTPRQQIERVAKGMNNAPYEGDYKAIFKGIITSEQKPENEIPFKYELFYNEYMGHERMRVDTYFGDALGSIHAYYATADRTFTRMFMSASYAEPRDGYYLPFKYLDQFIFATDQQLDKYVEFLAKFENLENGERVVYVKTKEKDGEEVETWYSLKYKFPIEQKIKRYNNITHWWLEDVDESVKLVDNLFDEDAITNWLEDEKSTDDVDFVSTLTDELPDDFRLDFHGTHKFLKTNVEKSVLYEYYFKGKDAKLITYLNNDSKEVMEYNSLTDKTKITIDGNVTSIKSGNVIPVNYLSKSQYYRMITGDDSEESTMRYSSGYEKINGVKLIRVFMIKGNGDMHTYYYDASTKKPFKIVIERTAEGSAEVIEKIDVQIISD